MEQTDEYLELKRDFETLRKIHTELFIRSIDVENDLRAKLYHTKNFCIAISILFLIFLYFASYRILFNGC